MKSSRRGFLKIAGVSALGLGAKPVINALASGDETVTPHESALTAKRWGMVVDLREPCPEGCTACIDACHSEHNVPDFGNPKDEIKWIWKDSYEHAFPGTEHPYLEEFIEEKMHNKPMILMCNHCDNPPCVRVCPTKATYKREDGLVLMDFHRCIGCRYCMAGCPFGARSLNWRDPRPFIKKVNPDYPTRTRGVVEKCNFCAERLAKGQPPACVEACQKVAEKEGREPVLVFGDMEDADSQVRELLREHHAIRRKPTMGTKPQVYYIL